MGRVRSRLLEAMPHCNDQCFVWITDFPLFTPAEDSDSVQKTGRGLVSTHHPFTAPRNEDIDLLQYEPLKVCGRHYDLVLNGVEIGGGSVRIHDAELQTYILAECLQLSSSQISEFQHMLHILKSGCPPHAGFALGMAICEVELTIRV